MEGAKRPTSSYRPQLPLINMARFGLSALAWSVVLVRGDRPAPTSCSQFFQRFASGCGARSATARGSGRGTGIACGFGKSSVRRHGARHPRLPATDERRCSKRLTASAQNGGAVTIRGTTTGAPHFARQLLSHVTLESVRSTARRSLGETVEVRRTSADAPAPELPFVRIDLRSLAAVWLFFRPVSQVRATAKGSGHGARNACGF